MDSFFKKVYRVVRAIPRGKVATYGQVARIAGRPHAARMVGWAMSASSSEDPVPWFRVVGAGGRLVISKAIQYFQIQKQLLKQEGVQFRGDRVEMSTCQWEKGLKKSSIAVHHRRKVSGA
jgi:methylated-DNA-protein-cysteine methyltransferase related protein